MRFSKGSKNKWLLKNPFKNINERDEKGRTILHYAAEVSDKKTVRLLIEKGIVDVNAADVEGYTPLHVAVAEQRLENVKELIRSGADVNAEEYGSKRTPLHLGCMVGEKEIVEELVKAGGEIDQLDELGKTAMDYAKNNKEVTEVLMRKTIEIEELLEKLSKLSERTVNAIFNRKLEEKGIEKLDRDQLVEEAMIEIEKELDDMKKKIKVL